MPDLQKPTWMMDGYGNPIGSLSGAVNTHDADVHIHPVNHFFYANLGNFTLATAIVSQDTSFTLTSATGWVVNDRVHLTDTITGAHDHAILRVTAVVGNTITVDRPIDKAYTIAGTIVTRLTIEINGIGTLAAPMSYIILPSPNEAWHVTSIDFSMTDATAMDDGTFGGIPALPNGTVIRYVDSTAGTYETFSVWRTNASFNKDGFSTVYSSKAPSGVYGYSGSMNIHDRYGAIVRLENSATSVTYMEILVQDDLSGLSTFEIKVHGHIETA